MKKPKLMGAITLVIATLLIASTTGLGRLPADEMNEEIETTVANILELIKAGVKLEDIGLERVSEEDVEQMGLSSLPRMNKASVSGEEQTLTTSAQKMSTEVFQPADTKAYTLSVKHPGLATPMKDAFNHEYTDTILGYELLYTDTENPDDDFDGLAWEASCDYLFSDQGYFIYYNNPNTGQPALMTYPSVDYWGKNGTRNRFFGTFEPDPAWDQGGHIWKIRFETCDILNNTEGSYWNWNDDPGYGFKLFKKADIACTDKYNETYFGRIALLVTEDVSSMALDSPAFFYQLNETGWGQIGWYSGIKNGDAACAYKDDETDNVYMMWDGQVEGATPPLNYEMLAGRYNESNTADKEAWYWYYEEEWLSTRHPSIAANDDCIIGAVEFVNTSTPVVEQVGFEIVLFEDGTTGGYRGGWLWSINLTTHPAGGKLAYPEISHVEGDTFMALCTFDLAGDEPDEEPELLITVSYDRGNNWTDLHKFSYDDVVTSEYRNVDIADKGSIVIWEYEREQEAKVTDYALHYMYETLTLDGHCTYSEGDEAPLGDVTLTNLDSGQVYKPYIGYPPGGGPPDNETSYFTKRLIMGINESVPFDIYNGTTLEIYAEDDVGVNKNTSQHTFYFPLALRMTWDLILREDGGPEYICGDVNNDDVVNLGDVVKLINYLYRGGPPPDPVCVGDVNNDDVVNLGDVVKLINYLYRGGDPPDPDCCNPPWGC